MISPATQLRLPAPAEPASPSTTDTAHLLLFNAQHASPDRSRRQAAWIAKRDDADIVVLTEVSSTQGGHALVTALADHGYATIIAPSPDTRDYRTVLACRITDVQAVPTPVTHLPHRAPAARITIAGNTLGILGLYVPSRGPKQHRNKAKRAFQEAVSAALPALTAAFPNMPVIIAGDLNVIEKDHQPPHKVFGRWEYAFYDSFKHAGYVDAFRHLHPKQIDHSWYGRSGNGFRFDHIFISSTHTGLLLSCQYDQSPRTNQLSDHAAMTLKLQLTTPIT